MRYLRLTNLLVVLSAAFLAGAVKPALAVVIWEENFQLHGQGFGMFGEEPNLANTEGTVFRRSANLAGATTGEINYYGTPGPTNTEFGLRFQPVDLAGESKAGTPAQNMAIQFANTAGYTFGTDKVRLTVVARQFDNTNDGDGISYWNNFAFGFTDTDRNLSNFLLLKRNPNNENRTHVQVFNNGKIYQTNLPALVPPVEPSINAEYFRELVLEYDPTKLNTTGVNPYTIIVDGTPYTLNSVNNVGPGIPPNPPDVGLPAMTTDGGATFNTARGVGWGFWFANDVHPDAPSPFLDRSVLIRSMKFETVPQSVGQPGDHNSDGVVDAADYVAWRKNGSPGGYELWSENFGEGGLGSGGGAAVPEPAAVSLLWFAAVATYAVRRSRAA